MASRLADAHIAAQAQLRTLAEDAVRRAWRGLPGYDEPDVDRFLTAVVPVVLAAQARSVALTDAFVAQSLGRAPLGVDADEVIAGLRGPTTPEQTYRRPFVTVWTALQGRTPWADAVASGEARATASAAMDVQMAMRGALAEIQTSDPGITGWQRVADPNACEFCQLVDGAKLKSPDAMALHNGCGCGIEPLTDSFTPTPAPEGVAVHEHGELGLTLADPSHHFTAL